MGLNNKIDLEKHKILTNKFGFKLCVSLVWRDALFQIIPVCIIALFTLSLIKKLEPVSLYILITVFILSYVLLLLLTNQYILNSLARIKYKDFTVCMVKDKHLVEKMEFYDCLCWRGSLLLRQIAVGLAYNVISRGLEYFQLSSVVDIADIDRIMLIPIQIIAIFWVLRTKKTGRLILMQPLKKQ